MFKVYGDRQSGNCYKVKLALSMLALSYTWVDIDILAGETHTPAFLAKNPNAKIPVLETPDGACISESNAIMYFLATGSPLIPQNALAHAHMLQWLFFEQYSHEPYIATARFIVRYESNPKHKKRDLAGKIAQGYRALAIMEQHLSHQDFFVENAISLADIGLFAYTHVAHEGGFDLQDYPFILHWLARIKAKHGFVAMV